MNRPPPGSSGNPAPFDPVEGDPSGRTTELINRIIRGDREALAELFLIYRPRLWRMVNFRLHPRLQGRVDADDVLQDAWLMAVDRIEYFLRDASHSSFIWFRMIVQQALVAVHRRHLGAEKRNAARDIPVHGGWGADSTSSSLAFHLSGSFTSPSSAVNRAELARQLDTILQGMNEIDREVLALRHFEELSNSETARVLNMSEQATSGRYLRALGRLKEILKIVPGFLDDQSEHGHSLRERLHQKPGDESS
jgi:RNA polymerase sigma-70 factor (ECF subfamily)